MQIFENQGLKNRYFSHTGYQIISSISSLSINNIVNMGGPGHFDNRLDSVT